ncbi:MAG: hypothetical protein H6Q33_4461 [Deltaproteobacteria bacterium]|nr:hypothetical protein [Deltaproteobacteria bacterium]
MSNCFFVPAGRWRLISRPDAATSKRSVALPACELRHGPIAQLGQSRRLITGRSQVRILVGPLV